jgi:hypothetical protein
MTQKRTLNRTRKAGKTIKVIEGADLPTMRDRTGTLIELQFSQVVAGGPDARFWNAVFACNV